MHVHSVLGRHRQADCWDLLDSRTGPFGAFLVSMKTKTKTKLMSWVQGMTPEVVL